MFELYTDRARQVVVLSGEEAKRLGHAHIGTEHILLGLIREGTGVAARALQAVSVEFDATHVQVRQMIHRATPVRGAPPAGHIPFTPRAKTVLEIASREARDLSHDYIGTEHILLALMREGEGAGARLLRGTGVEFADIRHHIRHLMRGGQESQPPG
jgi:ATP-dependent Clp protease ATP-binding subunit ClpC